MQPSQESSDPLSHLLNKLDWRGIRNDLLLHPRQENRHGEESWILEDPVEGSHFSIGENEVVLLRCLLEHKPIDKAIQAFKVQKQSSVGDEEIIKMLHSFEHLGLSNKPVKKHKGKTSLLNRMIYMKFPIIQPDLFLDRSLFLVRWLGSIPALLILTILSLSGLVLTFPKIELYYSTYNHLLTPFGVLSFLVSIVLLKICHEFAHAYVTKSLGYRVRSIGVALILFWPILYTDTSDTWKCRDRSSKILVSAAGLLFELFFAGLALLCWNFMSEGILKSLLFYVSGTSLLVSLFVNLNPLMKFDGYYMLMDYLEIPNLQTRSMQLLRYYTLRIFFDWRDKPPEKKHRKALLIYGLCAKVYRFFVLLSISLAIYMLFFKSLGMLILVMALISFFIVPLIKFLMYVIKQSKFIGLKKRYLMPQILLLLLCVSLFIPYSTFERLPGLLLFKSMKSIQISGQGHIVKNLPTIGTEVEQGDILLQLKNEELEFQITSVNQRIEQNEEQIKYLSTSGSEGAFRKLLQSEAKRLEAEKDKLLAEQALLVIRSPLKGKVIHINKSLRQNMSVHVNQYFCTVANVDDIYVKAYQGEKSHHLSGNLIQTGTLVNKGLPREKFDLALTKKHEVPVKHLEHNSLLDLSGGPIASQAIGESVQARESQVEMEFAFKQDKPKQYFHGQDVWVYTRAKSQSLMTRISNPIIEFIHKESWL